MMTKTNVSKNRDSLTALGVIDRMGYNAGPLGVTVFRSLSIMDQHTLLMKAWMEKENLPKAQRHALVLFESQMKENNYKRALALAHKYELWEQLKEAALGIYGEKMQRGECNSAIHMATDYDLGEEKVKEAVLGLYAQEMQEKKYSSAVYTAKKYGLIEQMNQAALNEYDEYMETSNYNRAAICADKYGLGETKMKEAASNHCSYMIEMCSKKEDVDAWANKYGLGEDVVKELTCKVCKVKILGGHHDLAMYLINMYGLDNEKVKEFALELYDHKMSWKEYHTAKEIASTYGLVEQENFVDSLAHVLDHGD